MYAWINANDASNHEYVNKRFAASVGAQPVGNLTTLGELVKRSDSLHDGKYQWKRYESFKGECFWIRADVHQDMLLDTPERVLDVPYVSQNEPATAFTDNDCGPACMVGLLAAVGIQTTVREFMQRASITHRNTTQYNELRRGVLAFGKDLKHIRPLHLSGILNYIKHGQPVCALLYRHHLLPGKRYGHFMNIVGYRIREDKLYIVAHDPDGKPYSEYPAEQFVRALANVNGNNNLPFQGMVIV